MDCGISGGHNLVCEWMMANRGGDDEDNLEFGNWTPVVSGRGEGEEKQGKEASGGHGSQNRKRVLEENSSDEGSSRVVRKRALMGESTVIIRFSQVDKQINVSLVVLSQGSEKEASGDGSGENFER